MTTVQQPNSKRESHLATMKLKLGVVLWFGLVLQFCLPACAKAVPASPHGRFHHVNSDLVRGAVMRDRNKEHATYMKISGESYRPGGRTRTGRELVSIPVGVVDFSFFEYLAEFSLGTPPRTFVGVADTGSDLVWVPCDPCVECIARPIFPTGTSSSFTNVPCSSTACNYWNTTEPPSSCPISGICPYNITYLTGATTGDLSSDILTIESNENVTVTYPNFTFGCAHTTDSETPYPIAGLSTGNLSLFGQLGPKAGNNTLAFCFGDFFEGNVTEINIGSEAKPNLTFTPLIPSRHPRFFANLTGISVDGTLLQIPPANFAIGPDASGAFILDTGTSFSLLLPEVYSSLRTAVDSNITYPPGNGSMVGFDLCYDVTTYVNASTTLEELHLPTITFSFPNVSLQLPVENSYISVEIVRQTESDSTLLVCLALLSSDFNLTIFGNWQMQNVDFFFDPDNSRVGMNVGCS